MSVNVNNNGTLERIAGGTLYADAPVGTIQAYGGAIDSSHSAPNGWLLCDGSEKNKTDFAELYAVIGDAFGTASDNTKFVLPDLREATTKGAGLTGLSNNHYDSDGLALGEFIDDRVQTHNHPISNTFRHGSGSLRIGSGDDTISSYSNTTDNNSGRDGATTEVKAVGVNYIIKAKQTALPADLESAVEDAVNEVTIGTATAESGITFTENTIRKNNKTICLNLKGNLASTIAGSGEVVATLPTEFRPSIVTFIPFISNYSGNYNTWQARIDVDGKIRTATGGGDFQDSFNICVSYIL